MTDDEHRDAVMHLPRRLRLSVGHVRDETADLMYDGLDADVEQHILEEPAVRACRLEDDNDDWRAAAARHGAQLS